MSQTAGWIAPAAECKSFNDYFGRRTACVRSLCVPFRERVSRHPLSDQQRPIELRYWPDADKP